MPQKILYRATDLGALQKDNLLFVAGDIVRIEVPIKRKDYAGWTTIKAKVQAWGSDIGIKIESVVPVITDKKDKPTAKREIHDAVPDNEILTSYATLNKIDERTLKIGLELLT